MQRERVQPLVAKMRITKTNTDKNTVRENNYFLQMFSSKHVVSRLVVSPEVDLALADMFSRVVCFNPETSNWFFSYSTENLILHCCIYESNTKIHVRLVFCLKSESDSLFSSVKHECVRTFHRIFQVSSSPRKHASVNKRKSQSNSL